MELDVVALSFAALDRVKSPPPVGPVAPAPPGTDYRQTVLAAGAAFLMQCVQSRVRYLLDDKHVCSPSCTRAEFGDVFICRRSGNLHYCDITRCDERKGIEGVWRCVFSGRRCGSDMHLHTKERQGSMSQFSEEKIKPFKGPKPPKPPKTPRVRSRTGIKGRKLAKATREKQENQHSLQADARKHLLFLLKKCPVPVPEALINRFCCTAVRLWVKCAEKADRQYRALKYRFSYHCYVLLYYMQTGLEFEALGLTLLPQHTFLVNHLPSMDDLPAYDINTTWHTKCTRQFLFAVQSLGEEEITQLCQQTRAIWFPDE